MKLSNEKRQEFKDFLKTVDKLGATHFLAEYLAENIVLINGDGSETIEVRNKFITEFKDELISQINERI